MRYKLAISLLILASAALSDTESDENPKKAEYLSLARRIVPYDIFKSAADMPGAQSELFSRKSYDVYTQALANEYRSTFTLAELKEIVKFCESPVGRKFRRFNVTNKAWKTWWEQMHPVPFWTCAMHPQIRMPKKGQCPVCGMDLISHKGTGENGTPKHPVQIWTCARHPKIRMLEKGKCPYCGRDLTPETNHGKDKTSKKPVPDDL